MDLYLIFFIVVNFGMFYLATKKPAWKILWSDFSLVFSKDGREEIAKENYNAHFTVSGYIAVAIVAICYLFSFLEFRQLKWGYVFVIFFILGYIGNALREMYLSHKGGKYPDGSRIIKFSFRDCRFGGYGSGIFAMGFYLIIEGVTFFMINGSL